MELPETNPRTTGRHVVLQDMLDELTAQMQPSFPDCTQ